jgi:hypothetical protein
VTGSVTYIADFNSVLEVCEIAIGIIENSVFENLNNKSLIINVMNGSELAYSWTFTGAYNAEAGIFNPDIDVTLDEDLDKDMNKALSSTKIKDSLVLDFAASGILPKNVTLTYYVGDKHADGTELLLFFYNEDTKNLEDMRQSLIVTDGYVTFTLTHCSYYVFIELNSDTAENTTFYACLAIIAIMLISIVTAISIRYGKDQ